MVTDATGPTSALGAGGAEVLSATAQTSPYESLLDIHGCFLSEGGVATIQEREYGPALVVTSEDCATAVARLREALGTDATRPISIDLEGSLGVSRFKAATVDLVPSLRGPERRHSRLLRVWDSQEPSDTTTEWFQLAEGTV